MSFGKAHFSYHIEKSAILLSYYITQSEHVRVDGDRSALFLHLQSRPLPQSLSI